MQNGPADEGKYSAYIHDNTFVSNDLFVGSTAPVDMTVRFEGNTFRLADSPSPTDGRVDFRRLGEAFETVIAAGGNQYEGTDR